MEKLLRRLTDLPSLEVLILIRIVWGHRRNPGILDVNLPLMEMPYRRMDGASLELIAEEIADLFMLMQQELRVWQPPQVKIPQLSDLHPGHILGLSIW